MLKSKTPALSPGFFSADGLTLNATQPFLGTVHLDALPYANVDLKQYYPYGNPAFPG